MANLEGIDTQYVKINQFFFSKIKKRGSKKRPKNENFFQNEFPVVNLVNNDT